jgi:hypothetical protein
MAHSPINVDSLKLTNQLLTDFPALLVESNYIFTMIFTPRQGTVEVFLFTG